jgi:hypothetical protein
MVHSTVWVRSSPWRTEALLRARVLVIALLYCFMGKKVLKSIIKCASSPPPRRLGFGIFLSSGPRKGQLYNKYLTEMTRTTATVRVVLPIVVTLVPVTASRLCFIISIPRDILPKKKRKLLSFYPKSENTPRWWCEPIRFLRHGLPRLLLLTFCFVLFRFEDDDDDDDGA